ncbi:unnamed protein product [Amaranthus hypochondriacus]
MMMNGSNNKNEEFSFPVISNNSLSNLVLSSSSSSSSSLWRISSRVYHQPEDHKVEENDDAHPIMEVRSMCEEILPSNYIRRDQEIDELVRFNSKQLEVEQSMDYLWEDFNEDENTDFINERKSIDGEMSVLKVNKITGTRPNNSRNKLVVIGKLLKGLISIRKSAQLKLFKVESKVFTRQA